MEALNFDRGLRRMWIAGSIVWFVAVMYIGLSEFFDVRDRLFSLPPGAPPLPDGFVLDLTTEKKVQYEQAKREVIFSLIWAIGGPVFILLVSGVTKWVRNGFLPEKNEN